MHLCVDHEDAYGDIMGTARAFPLPRRQQLPGNHVNLLLRAAPCSIVAVSAFTRAERSGAAAAIASYLLLPLRPPSPSGVSPSGVSLGHITRQGEPKRGSLCRCVVSASSRLFRGWLYGRWQTKTSFAQSRMNDGMRERWTANEADRLTLTDDADVVDGEALLGLGVT